ncbi:hypothetical protein BAU15_04625 [Enterococcus sp. JM4C]|uniref:AraC family transcriptional regulator n=1 Tax=Candidatus Enterococcus huntleyi TaxID=1857217 RepID=UPI00137B0E22|nr:AraC family transcriptional regulator [Enterococcus sp. JM4C]KAF1295823.1 hypothetical protein BAU15_04625 [Enterococcus sp. JM4C]
MPVYYNLTYQDNPFSIDSIGSHWEQPTVSRPSGYPYYHWMQTESGVGEINLEGKRIILKEGQGILIAPFVPHHYFAHRSSEWITSFATFNGSLANEIAQIVGKSPYLLAEEQPYFSFFQWVENQIHYQVSNPSTDSVELSIACYQFLMQLSRFQDQHANQKHELYLTYIQPVIEEIETNYKETVTVEELAEKVFVSPQYLSRLFQRFLGMSTYTFLLRYRLNKAKELLINRQELEVQQVAYLVGFKDTSHFVASFKKESKYTPLEFRRLHR